MCIAGAQLLYQRMSLRDIYSKGDSMKCRNDTINTKEQIKMKNFGKHWICAKCSCEIHYNDIVDHQKLCFQDDTAS